MKDLLVCLLNMTAIRMEVQPVFGAFHIITSLVCIILAITLSIFVTNVSYTNATLAPVHTYPDKSGQCEAIIIRILSGCGWFLVTTEIWKQLFIFYIVDEGVYDFWFLPFQLCSVPMYLCILLPCVPKRIQRTFLSFMAGYTFISAICTFIYPEDLLRPYLFLTLHGFIWHGILLFISLLIVFSGLADLSNAGFGRATILFLELSALAIILNIITEPCAARIAASRAIHSYPNMFYMSPYHISAQPLIGHIQRVCGIPTGIVIYAVAIIALSGLTAFAFRWIQRSVTN